MFGSGVRISAQRLSVTYVTPINDINFDNLVLLRPTSTCLLLSSGTRTPANIDRCPVLKIRNFSTCGPTGFCKVLARPPILPFFFRVLARVGTRAFKFAFFNFPPLVCAENLLALSFAGNIRCTTIYKSSGVVV
jgi:hypothetical protein